MSYMNLKENALDFLNFLTMSDRGAKMKVQ